MAGLRLVQNENNDEEDDDRNSGHCRELPKRQLSNKRLSARLPDALGKEKGQPDCLNDKPLDIRRLAPL